MIAVNGGITRRVCVFRHCTNPSWSILEESMEFKSSETRCLSFKINILQLFTDPLPPAVDRTTRAELIFPSPWGFIYHRGAQQPVWTVISRSFASLLRLFPFTAELFFFFLWGICFYICDLVCFPVKDYPTSYNAFFFKNPAPSDPCVMARNAD